MRIVLTGGGTAGHFYPLIAIAEAINKIAEKEKLVDVELFYMSTSPYDERALFDNGATFRRVFSGKIRSYFSIRNVTDMVPLSIGVLKALWNMFLMYPDVVVSKGGYASIPALIAARLLRIPVIVHESDTVPGRTNIWSAKFAKRIAVSWPETAEFFPAEKTAVAGQPVRHALRTPASHGAREYLQLEKDVPVILILGGSQGAKRINDAIVDILPELVETYQVIHQVGSDNLDEATRLAGVVLAQSEHKDRYRPFGFLNELALRMSVGAASLVISRAGSTIFEIAAWHVPSILIPITESNGDHQRKNAFTYARSGACAVIEESNLTKHVLLAEIARIMEDAELRKNMSAAAETFFRADAAETIAREVIGIALSHEAG